MADDPTIPQARDAVDAAGGLWTQATIARALGVTEQAVGHRVQRGTLPPPTFMLGKSRVWLGAQLPPDITDRIGS